MPFEASVAKTVFALFDMHPLVWMSPPSPYEPLPDLLSAESLPGCFSNMAVTNRRTLPPLGVWRSRKIVSKRKFQLLSQAGRETSRLIVSNTRAGSPRSLQVNPEIGSTLR